MPDNSVWTYLLDGFRLQIGGADRAVPRSVQRVLALVGLRRDVSWEEMAGVLWAEVPEQKAHASLRTVLWRIDRCCSNLVAATADKVRLGASIDVDVHAWTDAA